MAYRENAIEWYSGEQRISVTLTDKRYINKVMKLARQHKNKVDFIRNSDGSVFAHLPLSALEFRVKVPRTMGDDEKRVLAERLAKAKDKKKGAKKGE